MSGSYNFSTPRIPSAPHGTPSPTFLDAIARQGKVPKAPIHNPYDKFTQVEFDAWIGGITSALRQALGRDVGNNTSSTTKNVVPEETYPEGTNSEYSGDEDSFAEINARRMLRKGKMRDAREGPGLGVGAKEEPIEILSDSDESDNDDAEVWDGYEGSDTEVQYDLFTQEYEREEVDEIEGEIKRLKADEGGEGSEAEGDDRENGESEEEGEYEEGEGVEEDAEQYEEEEELETYASSSHVSQPRVFHSELQHQAVEDISKREDSDNSGSDFPGPTRAIRTEVYALDDDQDLDVNELDEDEAQPLETDTSFPLHSIEEEGSERRIDIPDPWAKPQFYAQDLYAGGEVTSIPGGKLDANHLGPYDDSVSDLLTPKIVTPAAISEVGDAVMGDGAGTSYGITPTHLLNCAEKISGSRHAHDALHEVVAPIADNPENFMEHSSNDDEATENNHAITFVRGQSDLIEPHPASNALESVQDPDQAALAFDDLYGDMSVIPNRSQTFDTTFNDSSITVNPSYFQNPAFLESYEGKPTVTEVITTDYSVLVMAENAASNAVDASSVMQHEANEFIMQELLNDDVSPNAQPTSEKIETESEEKQQVANLASSDIQSTVDVIVMEDHVVDPPSQNTEEEIQRHPIRHPQYHKVGIDRPDSVTSHSGENSVDIAQEVEVGMQEDSHEAVELPDQNGIIPDADAKVTPEIQRPTSVDSVNIKDPEPAFTEVQKPHHPSTPLLSSFDDRIPPSVSTSMGTLSSSRNRYEFGTHSMDEEAPVSGIRFSLSHEAIDQYSVFEVESELDESVPDGDISQADVEVEVVSAGGVVNMKVQYIVEEPLTETEGIDSRSTSLGVVSIDADVADKSLRDSEIDKTNFAEKNTADKNSEGDNEPPSFQPALLVSFGTSAPDRPQTPSRPLLVAVPGTPNFTLSPVGTPSVAPMPVSIPVPTSIIQSLKMQAQNRRDSNTNSNNSITPPVDTPTVAHDSVEDIHEDTTDADTPGQRHGEFLTSPIQTPVQHPQATPGPSDEEVKPAEDKSTSTVTAESPSKNVSNFDSNKPVDIFGHLQDNIALPSVHNTPPKGFSQTVVMRKPSHPVLFADPYPYSLSTPSGHGVLTKELGSEEDTEHDNSLSSISTTERANEGNDNENGPQEHSTDDSELDVSELQYPPTTEGTILPETSHPPSHALIGDVFTAGEDSDADGEVDTDYLRGNGSATHLSLAESHPFKSTEPRSKSSKVAVRPKKNEDYEVPSTESIDPSVAEKPRPTEAPKTQLAETSESQQIAESSHEKEASETQLDSSHSQIIATAQSSKLSSKRKRSITPGLLTRSASKRAEASTKDGDAKDGDKKKTHIRRKALGKHKSTIVREVSEDHSERSVKSQSSSASSAAKMLQLGSRASSVASSAPSEKSSSYQQSPTIHKPGMISRQLSALGSYAALFHAHGRARTNILQQNRLPLHIVPQQAPLTQHQLHKDTTPPAVGDVEEPSPVPAETNSITVDPPSPVDVSHRSSRPDTTSSSPVTRSHCRYHKISLPKEEGGPRVCFLVPGCSLTNKELMEEEEIEDHGDATREDGQRMVEDIQSLDFNSYLIGVLRQLVGLDILREQEVFYLPQPGEDIPKKAIHHRTASTKTALVRLPSRDSPGGTESASYHGSPVRSIASVRSPASSRPPLSVSGSLSSVAQKMIESEKDIEQTSSMGSELTDYPTEDEGERKMKRARPALPESSIGQGKKARRSGGIPSIASHQLQKRRSKRISVDAHGYKPESDGEETSTDADVSTRRKSTKRGVKRTMSSENSGEGAEEHNSKKQKTRVR